VIFCLHIVVSNVHFPWTFAEKANKNYDQHLLIISYLVSKYLCSGNRRCN